MIFSTLRKRLILAAAMAAVSMPAFAQQDVIRRPLNPGSVPQLQLDQQQMQRPPQPTAPAPQNGAQAPRQRSTAPGAGNGQAAPAQNAPAAEAQPRRNANPVAEFSGIDKITGRIISFDVYVNETVQFGALQVTPRVCYSSPDEDEPKTDSFVEVDEITLDRKIRRIFTGWMFAESPGLNAVEHPVYDVWLKSCKKSSEVPPPQAVKAGG